METLKNLTFNVTETLNSHPRCVDFSFYTTNNSLVEGTFVVPTIEEEELRGECDREFEIDDESLYHLEDMIINEFDKI